MSSSFIFEWPYGLEVPPHPYWSWLPTCAPPPSCFCSLNTSGPKGAEWSFILESLAILIGYHMICCTPKICQKLIVGSNTLPLILATQPITSYHEISGYGISPFQPVSTNILMEYVILLNKTGNKSVLHMPILRYGQLKLAQGWK